MGIMAICGIYKIVSPSGKVYIGQSRDIELRWYNHRHPNSNIKSKLYSSLKSYGWRNHTFELIHELPEDVEQSIINEYEHFYFTQYGMCGIVMLNTRGDFNAMGRHSEETRLKISTTGKGRKHTEEFKKKVGDAHRGMKRSAETCKNISESLKGRVLSQESINKMSLARKGKPLSEETKNKLSIANKGRKLPKEACEKISVFWKGRKRSPEQVEKHRKFMTGRPSGRKGFKMSEEQKQKISLSTKGINNNTPEHMKRLQEINRSKKMPREAIERMMKTRLDKGSYKKINQCIGS